MEGGETEEAERLAAEGFPVIGQPSAAAEPGEGAFDDPALGQDEKVLGLIRAFDNLNRHLRESSSMAPEIALLDSRRRQGVWPERKSPSFGWGFSFGSCQFG